VETGIKLSILRPLQQKMTDKFTRNHRVWKM